MHIYLLYSQRSATKCLILFKKFRVECSGKIVDAPSTNFIGVKGQAVLAKFGFNIQTHKNSEKCNISAFTSHSLTVATDSLGSFEL